MTAENSSGRCRRCPEQKVAAALDAETMTTFGTTRTDHSTAASGTHANQKAVGALAAHNRRLVGAFHGNIP
jgi:hypothetical protein